MKNTLKYLVAGVLFNAALNFAVPNCEYQGENKFSSLYGSLYKNSRKLEEECMVGPTTNLRRAEAQINDGLKIDILFVDNTLTPQEPDYATTVIYERKNGGWKYAEIFKDSDLNGIQMPDYKNIETFDPKFTLQDDYLIKKNEYDKFPSSVFSDGVSSTSVPEFSDSTSSISMPEINGKLLFYLEQLLTYSSSSR